MTIPAYKIGLQNGTLLESIKPCWCRGNIFDSPIPVPSTTVYYTRIDMPRVNSVYSINTSLPANYKVAFKAFDKAGNSTETSTNSLSITLSNENTAILFIVILGVNTEDKKKWLTSQVIISGAAYKYVCDNWSSDLAVEYSRENDEQFLRKELSGSLKFYGDDYDFIIKSGFKQTQYIKIWQALNDGTYSEIFFGKFSFTDCEIDDYRKIVEADIEPLDEYTDILNGLDNEYDLMKLPVSIESLTYYKRTAVQIYRLGSDKIGWYIGGNYWETDTLNTVTDPNILRDTYYFTKNLSWIEIKLTANGSTPKDYEGIYCGSFNESAVEWTFTNQKTGAKIYVYFNGPNPAGTHFWELKSPEDEFLGYKYVSFDITTRTFSLSKDTDDYYTAELIRSDYYLRLLTNVDSIGKVSTYEIPQNDIVDNNRNYHRCIGLDMPESLAGYGLTSEEPTEWGKTPDGEYYKKIYILGYAKAYPIVRTEWIWTSVWFVPGYIYDIAIEPKSRYAYKLRDAYEFSSCIQALLTEMGTMLIHEDTPEYSQFLYGKNPFSTAFKLFITQKSNILNGEYTQPAQKAPITLRKIFDMLKNCFNCYWYVDGNKLKIEHINFFRNGMSYSAGTQIFGLTNKIEPFNKKAWLFDTARYKFEKAEMPARYEYEWMDDVSDTFKGLPVEVVSNFVQKDNVEKISVDSFTSDVDMLLLNPSNMSKDGFVLFAAVESNGGYVLPIVNVTIDNIDYSLQNGYAAFCYLQSIFLIYNMPAPYIRVNNVVMYNEEVFRGKIQELNIPLSDIFANFNPAQLIQTQLGYGQIEKMSIKLRNLMASMTLKFNTNS